VSPGQSARLRQECPQTSSCRDASNISKASFAHNTWASASELHRNAQSHSISLIRRPDTLQAATQLRNIGTYNDQSQCCCFNTRSASPVEGELPFHPGTPSRHSADPVSVRGLCRSRAKADEALVLVKLGLEGVKGTEPSYPAWRSQCYTRPRVLSSCPMKFLRAHWLGARRFHHWPATDSMNGRWCQATGPRDADDAAFLAISAMCRVPPKKEKSRLNI